MARWASIQLFGERKTAYPLKPIQSQGRGPQKKFTFDCDFSNLVIFQNIFKMLKIINLNDMSFAHGNYKNRIFLGRK